MNIDFVFDNEVENFENNYEQDFTAIIEQALKTLGIEDDVEVSCVLVDDERIHEINREYRHIDRSTDVISFAMEDNDQFYVEGMPRTLGDIFISVDRIDSASTSLDDAEIQGIVGKEGITTTALRPSGNAEIDGKRYDVVTSGEFIQKDTRITVERIDGLKILVKRAEDAKE